MTDPNDRFGMPASAFKAARESHGVNSPVFRAGMYVPTRYEVSTLPIAQLSPIAIDWMWESPSELIPDNNQIGELRALLAARPDADESTLRELIIACDDYLKI
ncbi:MAG: hypothetical protein J0I96_13450 [Rhodanobacter sp.]|nr:hypothetical protein [Rhodanobacter sp.]